MYSNLTQIGLKHQTDKAYFHLFTEFYNDYFERFLNRPIHILEIGISEGKSLLLLQEYFKEATIHAIDINPSSVHLELGNRIHTHLCSQIDFDKLQTIFKDMKFDIIIDDGSHLTSHQQASLGFLFPYLKPNGIYICEDIHTSFSRDYIDTPITTFHMFDNFKITNTIVSDVMDECQKKYLLENISCVEIYERKENAIMCYRCKSYNYHRVENCLLCNADLSASDRSITSILIHR
jgi:23S rRNA U2552 (ribose-2'-O)-methylase RlmE/FtsJ